VSTPKTRRLKSKIHRLINSRYPPIGVFDAYVDNLEELRIAFQIEQLTNPRLNTTIGALGILPNEEIITDRPNASVIMAAFIHTAPGGGRFNDERLGAWYGGRDLDTAMDETLHHNERRLGASSAGFPCEIQLREYVTDISAELIDLRGQQKEYKDLYQTQDYSASQKFANKHRWPFSKEAASGIAFDSVRRAGGQNVVIFRPSILKAPVTQADHYQYNWDATGEVSVARITRVK